MPETVCCLYSSPPPTPQKPPTNSPEGERGQTPVQGYVHTVHDFCHDSANQASLLALAAPKIQSSRGGVLSTLLNSQTPLKMGQEAGYSYLSLITSPFSLGKAPTLLTKDYCPNSHTPKRVGNMILSCNYYSFLCRNRKKYGKKSKKYHIFLSEYSIFAN